MKRSIIFSVFIGMLASIYGGYVLHKKNTKAPYLTVIGFAEMADGIGRQSVEIMHTLHKKVSVGFRPTRRTMNYIDVPSDVQALMSKRYPRLGKVVIYEDIFYPTSAHFFRKKFFAEDNKQIRLAYSMFESSEIPPAWVHNLNLYFDAAIVPDAYNMQSYINSGVTIPIFVLPLGLNLQDFLNRPIKNSSHDPFVFANFSTCISRKNHLMLIRAFHAAFGDNPHVRLWINSKYTEENLFSQLEEEVKVLKANNITLTSHCYNKADYLDNFDKIDCYVSLSQSEGFSIQPREAMALGIPCIVSDNTAQSTICKSGFVKAVASPVLEPAYYEIFQDVFGFRYNVSLEDTASAMKDVYLHFQDYLSKNHDMRLWAAKYDYNHLHPLYISLVKPKKVILGDHNEIQPEVLITNSEKLYKKYKSL